MLFVILRNITASYPPNTKAQTLNLLVLYHCCLLGHLWPRGRHVNQALLTKRLTRCSLCALPEAEEFISRIPVTRRDRGSQSNLCARSSPHWLQEKHNLYKKPGLKRTHESAECIKISLGALISKAKNTILPHFQMGKVTRAWTPLKSRVPVVPLKYLKSFRVCVFPCWISALISPPQGLPDCQSSSARGAALPLESPSSQPPCHYLHLAIAKTWSILAY